MNETIQFSHTKRIILLIILYSANSGILVNATQESAVASTSEEYEWNEPSEFTNENITRESTDFLLPDKYDELGHKCLLRSKHFCLMGFSINGKYSEREPQPNDKEVFSHLVHESYKSINWYSFKPQDQKNDGCCSHQTAMYMQHGQRSGLSPVLYYNKIFGPQIIQQKKLVFIKAYWNRKLCANIVSQVGFGKGELKVVAKRGLKSKFIFPPVLDRSEVPVFSGSSIQTSLAFKWFLYHIVCLEKPDLCPPYMQNRDHSSGER